MCYVFCLLLLCLMGCSTIGDRQGQQQVIGMPWESYKRTQQADRKRPVHSTQINDRIAEVDPEMATVNLLVAQGLSPEKAVDAVKEISSNRSAYGAYGPGRLGSGTPAHPNFRASRGSTELQPGVIVNRTSDWQTVTIAGQLVHPDGTVTIEPQGTYQVPPLVQHTNVHNNYVSLSLRPGDYQVTVVGGSTENKHIDSDPTDTWVGLDESVGGPSIKNIGWAHIIRGK